MKPTRARYGVIFFAVTLAILSYIDRVCMSKAAPHIVRDLALNPAQMGKIFGTFGLAYALFEIPTGWLGDRMGPRKILMRIVLWWSAFTALTGWMWSYWSLRITQFLFGAGEAGGFPNLTKSFTTWLPENERVRAQGIMWTFARWGGAFTPLLVGAMLVHISWRWAFTVFGGLGLIWAVFFYGWYRDNPRDHKGVNAAELALIGDARKNASGHGDVPWKKLVTSRSIVLLWAQYFCLSFPWYFFITWMPTYLEKYRGVPESTARFYETLPLLLGGFGCLFCGLISRRLSDKIGARASRRALAIAGFAGAAALMAISVGLRNPMWTMVAMGMASFCNDLAMPPSWGACMDIGGKYAGTVSGSMNMMGNLAGFVSPVFGGYILQKTGGNFPIYIYTMAGMYALGTLCWPFIDPVTPLEPVNTPEAAAA